MRKKEIRQALAMGADKAIHIKDEGGSRGPLEISQALADVIKDREYDMVLFGRQSIDADNSAVGVITAGLAERSDRDARDETRRRGRHRDRAPRSGSRHRGHRGQAARGVPPRSAASRNRVMRPSRAS